MNRRAYLPDRTWFAIDGNNMAFKDFCTGDVSGGRMRLRLKAIRGHFAPTRLIVAFDPHDGSSFRREVFPGYKANRGEKPEGWVESVLRVRTNCIEDGIETVMVPGFEADDIIATIVAGAMCVNARVVMVSSDKDLRQLLLQGRTTQMTSFSRDRDRIIPEWITAEIVEKKFGVLPEQWIDYQTLVGDKCDNVAGCAGVGPKAAVEILQQCRTLDDFYRDDRGVKLSDRQRDNLAAFRESGELEICRTMVTLRSDVPIGDGITGGRGAEGTVVRS